MSPDLLAFECCDDTRNSAAAKRTQATRRDIVAKFRAIGGSSDKQAICAAYWLINRARELRAFRLWELTYPQPNNKDGSEFRVSGSDAMGAQASCLLCSPGSYQKVGKQAGCLRSQGCFEAVALNP